MVFKGNPFLVFKGNPVQPSSENPFCVFVIVNRA